MATILPEHANFEPNKPEIEISVQDFLEAYQELRKETDIKLWKDDALNMYLASIPSKGISTYGSTENEAIDKLINKYVLLYKALKFS